MLYLLLLLVLPAYMSSSLALHTPPPPQLNSLTRAHTTMSSRIDRTILSKIQIDNADVLTTP